MSARRPPYNAEALSKCEELGLHPIPEPTGEMHHTEFPFTDEDKRIGDALSYFLGTLFADHQAENDRYWHYEKTSIDEWSRVARALRYHGLMIVDQKGRSDG